jgi:hypothetical protein
VFVKNNIIGSLKKKKKISKNPLGFGPLPWALGSWNTSLVQTLIVERLGTK